MFTRHIPSPKQVRMAHREFAPDARYQVCQVGAVTNVGEQGTILFINRLPICAMHLGIVKILALDAPRLFKDLFPLRAWINSHFDLGHADWTIASLSGPLGSDDTPVCTSSSGGLIKKLLLITRDNVRANTFQEWRG